MISTQLENISIVYVRFCTKRKGRPMNIHRFTVPVHCGFTNHSVDPDAHQGAVQLYEDHGFIILPKSYSKEGPATRLVISCHGAGGTVSTDDSQVEHQSLTKYLVANGYAVMDVNGLPLKFAEEAGIDIRNNIGSPIAVRSYIKAYRYCIEHYNLLPEVFVHGASMGGISSTNLVRSGMVPVIAHSAFCPVLDTYHEIFLKPWSNGLPKTALGIIYRLDADANGEYIYDESKIGMFNPAGEIMCEGYPVPVKFWQCEDDGVVSFQITEKYVNKLRNSGADASLRAFPCGGHEPQLAGKVIENPAGCHIFEEETLEITPAVEEVFFWIQNFNKEKF